MYCKVRNYKSYATKSNFTKIDLRKFIKFLLCKIFIFIELYYNYLYQQICTGFSLSVKYFERVVQYLEMKG